MENKRSKGVNFFAQMFIISGVLGIFLFITNNQIFKNVISSLGLSVSYVICGIFLLKLKELARRIAIYLSFFSFIIFSMVLNSTLRHYIENHTYPYNNNINLILIGGVPLIIGPLICIYFFTRPKVKEQFKATL